MKTVLEYDRSMIHSLLRRLPRVALAMSLILGSAASVCVAQTDNVGVGTITPAPSAIMDVANPYNAILNVPSKGLLVPAVTQIQRDLMEGQYNDTLANGLLIYEPDSGNFWYYRYDNPIPATAPFGTWVKLTIAASSANGGTPQGGIIMWTGTTASIPSGWSLCDGSNGTPDLTDKFIISIASSAENPGTAPVPNYFVNVGPGVTVFPDRRFFKLAYIMKL